MPSDAATCNRLTLLIGRHWFHHNLDPRTRPDQRLFRINYQRLLE